MLQILRLSALALISYHAFLGILILRHGSDHELDWAKESSGAWDLLLGFLAGFWIYSMLISAFCLLMRVGFNCHAIGALD